MPKGPSPYLPMLQFAVKQLHARGGFLYLEEGMHGDSWCVWAPPEVAARMPEFLEDAAADLESQGTRESSRFVAPLTATGDMYRDAAEAACRAAEARIGFIYLLEGNRGSAWSMFAPPTINPLAMAELLRGFAHDLKGEEPVLRGDASLN
jgi:hypothetical protein